MTEPRRRGARVFVPLRYEEITRLQEMAHAARRRPADQAAVLISRALGVPSEDDDMAASRLAAAG